MASYYGSGYANQTGGDAGGAGGNAYYSYGQEQQQQQPPNQQQHQQQQSYANPNNQWQQQSQQQHQPQQQSQMQPQQQAQQTNQQPSFWNPATAATMAAMAGSMGGINVNNPDAMFDLASTAGKSFLATSSARMIPGFEATMVSLRGYFAVDNRYVKSKMQRILFPFRNKSWKRLVSSMYDAMYDTIRTELNGTRLSYGFLYLLMTVHN